MDSLPECGVNCFIDMTISYVGSNGGVSYLSLVNHSTSIYHCDQCLLFKPVNKPQKIFYQDSAQHHKSCFSALDHLVLYNYTKQNILGNLWKLQE